MNFNIKDLFFNCKNCMHLSKFFRDGKPYCNVQCDVLEEEALEETSCIFCDVTQENND